MNCPKCKTVSLKRKSHSLSTSTTKPYSCSGCSGIWLRSEDLTQISCTAIEDENSDENRGHDSKTGLCPDGHGLLIRAKIDLDPPFYLERCTHCGGIWFDKGEWNQIVNNHLCEYLPDFWSRAWQRQQKQKKNRENFLETNRNLLGKDIFDAVMTLAKQIEDHPEKLRAIALLQNEVR